MNAKRELLKNQEYVEEEEKKEKERQEKKNANAAEEDNEPWSTIQFYERDVEIGEPFSARERSVLVSGIKPGSVIINGGEYDPFLSVDKSAIRVARVARRTSTFPSCRIGHSRSVLCSLTPSTLSSTTTGEKSLSRTTVPFPSTPR